MLTRKVIVPPCIIGNLKLQTQPVIILVHYKWGTYCYIITFLNCKTVATYFLMCLIRNLSQVLLRNEVNNSFIDVAYSEEDPVAQQTLV